MKKFGVEDVQQAFKVQLFNGNWLYVDKKTQKLNSYRTTWVNGKEKVDRHKLIKSYQIENIFPEIKKIIALDNSLVADRRDKTEELTQPGKIEIKQEHKISSFFLKPISFSVEKLTDTQKRKIEKDLERENISYCRFIDNGRFTLIKTTPTGYRVLAYFLSQ